ncbi:MAG: Glutamine--fructose-6-phosphate aminotransferase [isomerizing], partial [Alphaproteobacteria bacterium MarineAlpha7_Bin1]
MCGIIGIVGKKQVAPLLLEALKRLEYRGYDSAGIATLDNGGIERRRSEGKISKLEKLIAKEPIVGKIGIGHTRWATHGAPNEINAHPHSNDRLAVVHNGIIENFYSLKEELQSLGFQFTSETDSEVIIHLITHYLDKKMSPRRATER